MTSSSSTPSSTASDLVFRPAAERFHSQLDWLDSWHSFSFSNHYDQAWMGYGPLRVIRQPRRRAARISFQHYENRPGDRPCDLRAKSDSQTSVPKAVAG